MGLRAKIDRSNFGVTCRTPALLEAGSTHCAGECERLSLRRAFVRCEAAPPGDAVQLTLCLPSLGPVEVDGKVLWRRLGGCSIRFTHLAAGALAALCTFLGAVD